MIKLQCIRFDSRGVPVLSDAEIDRFVHNILMDYKPGLLKKPGKINYAHFIESYLEAQLDYMDIFNEDPDKPIFGMTAFNGGEVKVFDRDCLCVKKIRVKKRTVILDNHIMQEGKEGLALFTALHEAGHLCLHSGEYAEVNDFDQSISSILCRRDNIESFTSRKRKHSPKDWQEHQADCFAACIAMPGMTFIPFVLKALCDNGIWKTTITLGRDEDTDYIAQVILPELISETYGVSKAAAFIKMIKCGFVIDRERYNEKRKRCVSG